MPRSFRDIIAYGDFVLPGLTEGVLLRIGRNGKVEGMYLSVADIPDLPITKITLLGDILAKKVEQINGRSGVQIVLSPSDIGAIAAAKNLADIANIAQARINLGLGSAAVANAENFELAGAVNNAIALHQQSVNHPLATTSTAGLMSSTDKAKLNGISLADTLSRSGNLSDLTDKPTARNNLELGSAALASSSSFEAAGAVNSAIALHQQGVNHPLANTSTAGLMSPADKTKLNGMPSSTDILSRSGNLSDLADKPTSRSNLGLGSAAIASSTNFEAAGAVNSAIALHQQSTNHPLATTSTPGLMSSADKTKLNGMPSSTDILSKSANLSDLADKPTARTSLGLGSAAIADSSSFESAGAVSNHANKSGKGFHLPATGITDSEVAGAAAIADTKIAFSTPARIAVTYAMNWATYAGTGGGDAISYRKFANNMVQLSGAAAKSIALISSDLICTLPVGYRPDKLVRFVAYGATSTGTLVAAFLTIATTGEVRINPGSTSPTQYVAIPDNCIFFAT